MKKDSLESTSYPQNNPYQNLRLNFRLASLQSFFYAKTFYLTKRQVMRNFTKTLFISLLALSFSLNCYGKIPTKESLLNSHDQFVSEGRNLIRSKTTTPPPIEELLESSPFSSYPFVLWDYAEDIQSTDSTSDATHWTNLLAFISKNTITKVITNVKDPSTFPFFGVSAEGASFMTYAATIPSSCELAILFELSDFAWDSTPPPTPNPAALPSPYPALPSYFADLPLKMEWVRQMIDLGIPIKEVVLDAQPIDPPGDFAEYQLLINYMDYFCTVNNLDNLRLAMTYGINVKEPTLSNLSSFPTPINLAPPGNFPPLTSGFTAPEWRPSTTHALLGQVYIQVYEPDMPYIFTLPNNPTLAATSLLHNFRDEPYILGEGTISFSPSSKVVTGTNTAFLTSVPPVTADMPIGVLQSNAMVLVGLVSETVPITENSLSVNSNPSSSGTNLPFYQTELINKWTFPFTTQKVVNNICLIFSFENQENNKDPFFGTWTQDQFMDFLTLFLKYGNTTLPFYMKDSNTPLSIPSNIGIYDFVIFQENMIE